MVDGTRQNKIGVLVRVSVVCACGGGEKECTLAAAGDVV